MRIIQILNSPNWSGASNYCISVSKELINRGHEVLLLTEPGKPLKQAKKLGIPYDDTIRLNHRNPALYIHAIKRMKYIFKTFKPDVISSHINEGAWMAGLVAKKCFPHAVVARVRTDIDPPKGHFINRYVHHAWTDHILVGSIQHKELCTQILDYSPEKISVIYGGVDSEKFYPGVCSKKYFREEANASEDEILIGILARLDPVKGHEYALKALSQLKDLPVKFKIAAIGYENERSFKWLHHLASQLDIGDRLTSFGLRKDLPNVIDSIDIGLISSIGSEANSRAALEFMACGKPMVATSVGVIPEIILDSEQGFIVPPKNPTETANALKKIILDENLRKQLGKNARTRIEQNFSVKEFGKITEAVYQKIIENR